VPFHPQPNDVEVKVKVEVKKESFTSYLASACRFGWSEEARMV
jgi:hypothetical protein